MTDQRIDNQSLPTHLQNESSRLYEFLSEYLKMTGEAEILLSGYQSCILYLKVLLLTVPLWCS